MTQAVQSPEPSSEKRLETLQTLFAVSRAISSTLELEPLFAEILGAVSRLLEVEHCSVMLVEPAGTHLKIAAANGLDPRIVADIRLPIGQGIAGTVAKTGESLLTQDIVTDPRFALSEERPEFRTRSALSVALRYKGTVIGVVNVNNKQTDEVFTRQDLELLEAIASQTAIAIVNARNFEEVERKVRELTLVNEVGQIVNTTHELDRLFGLIIDLVTRAMGVENCSLMLVQPITGHLKIVTARGLDPKIASEVVIHSGEGISGTVLQTGEPLLIRDISADPRFAKRGTAEYSTRSALSVPLKAKGVVVGVINVNNKVNHQPFTESDLTLLSAISHEITIALENAKLYHQMQQKISELLMIQKLGIAICSSLEVNTVLSQIIENLILIFDADTGSLLLWDEARESLRIKAQRGIPEGEVPLIRFLGGEGIAGEVASSGDGVLVSNTESDPRYKKFRANGSPKSLIAVPLLIRSKIEGVLCCEKVLDHTGAFTHDNLELLTTIGTQAAIALDNAALYKDLLDAYLHTTLSLAAAIEAKDSYTHGHSQRVSIFGLRVAQELRMSPHDQNTLRHSALLHDIGKIGIADTILRKPGMLTEDEFMQIKNHPDVGATILESVDFLHEVRLQMRHHHERWDGKGYPDGLIGNDIPIGSRIIAVVDTYDAMTSTRPYRKGLKHEVAVEEIKRFSGAQFDPAVVDAFTRCAEEFREIIDRPIPASDRIRTGRRVLFSL